MEFVDWRKSSEKKKVDGEAEIERPNAGRLRGKMFSNYIDEQIREAEARGTFANLPGSGKPLKLEDDIHAGDKALAYSLLKNNDAAPPEIELLKEIQRKRQKAEERLNRLIHQGKWMREKLVPPSASEKQSFNKAREKAAQEYDELLRSLNKKILTLNLSTPTVMHQSFLEVEKLVQQFRESCPLL